MALPNFSASTSSKFICDLYPCDETIFLIFGYGSLLWKQEFPFTAVYNTSVYGYQRLFYQGTKDHRGTPDDPGRVVTLLPAPSPQDVLCSQEQHNIPEGASFSHPISSSAACRVDGKAFQLPTDPNVVQKILQKLDARETGYERVEVTLMDFDRLIASGGMEKVQLDIFSHKNTPKDMETTMMKNTLSSKTGDSVEGSEISATESNLCQKSSSDMSFRKKQRKKVVALTYIATEDSSEFLGADSLESIAQTIWRCHGPSGANKDYLYHLVASLEEMGGWDPHVFQLNTLVRKLDQEWRATSATDASAHEKIANN